MPDRNAGLHLVRPRRHRQRNYQRQTEQRTADRGNGGGLGHHAGYHGRCRWQLPAGTAGRYLYTDGELHGIQECDQRTVEAESKGRGAAGLPAGKRYPAAERGAGDGAGTTQYRSHADTGAASQPGAADGCLRPADSPHAGPRCLGGDTPRTGSLHHRREVCHGARLVAAIQQRVAQRGCRAQFGGRLACLLVRHPAQLAVR